MAAVDPGSLVLITGGNGFIAAHCIANVLKTGYRVRATVRSSDKAIATREALDKAGVEHLDKLELVIVADPTKSDALSLVMQDCQAVLHLASAFNYEAIPGEFETKLMIPALRGTQAVCEAARLQTSVRRVVIMSSFASVYNASLGLQPGRVYTEDDWCPLTYQDGVDASAVPIAYRASKVVAEKAAWDFVHNNPVQFKLITLCPGMVFGKMIHPIASLSHLNASNQIVWDVLKVGRDGEIPATKAPIWVDVEDLAEASKRALTFAASSHERFLVTQSSYDTQEIADVVRKALPDMHNVPIGNPGARLAHTHYSCDSSKVRNVLGMQFKMLEQSIVPLARQLFDMDSE